MTTDLIRYDLLVQDALKGVVRRVLTDAGRDGLPGEHHFYISFRTDRPGVRISPRLRERYPQDMTIVLQHQFDNLSVQDHAFEVGLSFSGVAERLRIPFDALTGFFDPSVQFGLKFETQEVETPAPDTAAQLTSHAGAAALTGATGKLRPSPADVAAEPQPRKAGTKKPAEPTSEEAGGGEVVSLDAFRKKS